MLLARSGVSSSSTERRFVFCDPNRNKIAVRSLPLGRAVLVVAKKDSCTNMDLSPRHTLGQRLGQSFNASGIVFFAKLALMDRSLAIPHVEVDDLSAVSWTALWEAGFRGCIFDKDNTITEPYQLTLEPSAAKGLEECRKAFHGNIVLYSNSAGLQQFDPNGEEAMKLEAALGIPVLRHRQKKPAGDAEDIEKHFGCDASKIIMIGDRYLTDVAFGNRLGMLTIRQKPFTSSGEPVAVRAARLVEESFVAQCLHRGVVAPKHPLLRTLDKGVLMNCSAIENGGRRGVC